MKRPSHPAIAVILVAVATAVTAGAASGRTTQTDSLEVFLADVVDRVEEVLPESWRVTETNVGKVPIGWSGDASGVYVMVEDTRTRFFHPSGFHYYSFYRIWLMPPAWEGEMRDTPYISDSVPAFLLGVNDRYVAFYHTAGGNVWPDGPETLCAALDLDRICYTDLTRRVVDLEMERRLTESAVEAGVEQFVLNPHRIVGLTGEGPNLYLEYVFPDETEEPDALEQLTHELAWSVFELIPEVESIYLRRCTTDSYTDTIVIRN